jgi:tetrahydromethanopterin S-methyltransferase subunit C
MTATGTGSSASADQAALLGVALAAAVTIALAPEKWDLSDSLIGLVLTMIVLAFLDWSAVCGPSCLKRRQLAVAAVLGLCSCVTFGVAVRHQWREDLQLVGFWVLVTAAIYVYFRRTQRVGEESDAVPPPSSA